MDEAQNTRNLGVQGIVDGTLAYQLLFRLMETLNPKPENPTSSFVVATKDPKYDAFELQIHVSLVDACSVEENLCARPVKPEFGGNTP